MKGKVLKFVLVLLTYGTASLAADTIRPVKVSDLFAEADAVVVLKVLSGDSEHYPVAVYKAKIVKTFKGPSEGAVIFFGPFIGHSVGNEYLGFLRKAEAVKPLSTDSTYGPLETFFRVMYEGYSLLEIDYVCVFDGKEPHRWCDYGVRLNPRQIVVPQKMRTFPNGPATEVTNCKKWIRREAFVAMLTTLQTRETTHTTTGTNSPALPR